MRASIPTTGCPISLTVGLGDTLQLVLLLDGVTVGGALRGVDELIGETLGDGLDVSEGSLAGASDEEPDSLVHAAERRNVDGLTTDSSRATDTSGILPRPAVDNGIGDDLQRILSGEEMDDLESVLDDANRHQFFAVVSSVHHQRIRQSLHDGALSLSEPLGGISSGRVREIFSKLFLDGDVISQADVVDDDVVRTPLVEQLDLRQFWSVNLNWSCSHGHFFIPIFRHFWIR